MSVGTGAFDTSKCDLATQFLYLLVLFVKDGAHGSTLKDNFPKNCISQRNVQHLIFHLSFPLFGASAVSCIVKQKVSLETGPLVRNCHAKEVHSSAPHSASVKNQTPSGLCTCPPPRPHAVRPRLQLRTWTDLCYEVRRHSDQSINEVCEAQRTLDETPDTACSPV